MASKKKQSIIIKNKFVALIIVLIVAVIASTLLLIQSNIKLLGKLIRPTQQNSQNKSAASENTINCNKKLAQKGDSLASLVQQGKESANCLFMGCSGFFQ